MGSELPAQATTTYNYYQPGQCEYRYTILSAYIQHSEAIFLNVSTQAYIITSSIPGYAPSYSIGA